VHGLLRAQVMGGFAGPESESALTAGDMRTYVDHGRLCALAMLSAA
jgi:hypothetical protein